jgi:hypothetical protein
MLASSPRPTAKTPHHTVCRRVLASTVAYQEDRDKKLAVSHAAMDRSKEKGQLLITLAHFNSATIASIGFLQWSWINLLPM